MCVALDMTVTDTVNGISIYEFFSFGYNELLLRLQMKHVYVWKKFNWILKFKKEYKKF